MLRIYGMNHSLAASRFDENGVEMKGFGENGEGLKWRIW